MHIPLDKDLSFGGVKVECAIVVLKDRCEILSRLSSRYYCFIIIIIMIILFIPYYQCIGIRTVPRGTNMVK